MKEWKRYFLMRVIMTAVFGVAVGVLLLVFRSYAVEAFDILLIATGLVTAVFNLPRFVQSLIHVRARGEWINLLLAAASIVFGILLMLMRREFLLVILGLFTILLPAVRVALVENRVMQFKREIPFILFGFAMIFISSNQAEELVFQILGIAALVVSALYLLICLMVMKARFALYEKEQQALSTQEETK